MKYLKARRDRRLKYGECKIEMDMIAGQNGKGCSSGIFGFKEININLKYLKESEGRRLRDVKSAKIEME